MKLQNNEANKKVVGTVITHAGISRLYNSSDIYRNIHQYNYHQQHIDHDEDTGFYDTHLSSC